MLIIQNNNANPYFNLALEEYLLKEFNEDCFMLWQNEPCVVVGKNQNALAEINQEYIENNNIKVVRRLSGGGAVFHDFGNLNFTFIVNDTQNSFSDFSKFTKPVVEIISSLGGKALKSERNDLTIEGLKFSGNAKYKYKNRVLHHGTILFSSVLENIKNSLTPDQSKYYGNYVKSKSSKITNIKEHISQSLTIETFKALLQSKIVSEQNSNVYELTSNDIKQIKKLVAEKYIKWEWNYGISPEYSLHNQNDFAEVFLKVKSGIIQNIQINKDLPEKLNIEQLEQILVGTKHEKKAIKDAIFQLQFQNYFLKNKLAEFISLLF